MRDKVIATTVASASAGASAGASTGAGVNMRRKTFSIRVSAHRNHLSVVENNQHHLMSHGDTPDVAKDTSVIREGHIITAGSAFSNILLFIQEGDQCRQLVMVA
jgi:hypothetical protein